MGEKYVHIAKVRSRWGFSVVRVWLGRPRRRRPARHGFPSLPSRADPVGAEASRGSWLRSDAAQRVVCHVSALPQRCLRGVSRMTPPTGARGWSGPPGSDYTPWHPGADPAGTSCALCVRRIRASPASLPEEQVPAVQPAHRPQSADRLRWLRSACAPLDPGGRGPYSPARAVAHRPPSRLSRGGGASGVHPAGEVRGKRGGTAVPFPAPAASRDLRGGVVLVRRRCSRARHEADPDG